MVIYQSLDNFKGRLLNDEVCVAFNKWLSEFQFD